MSTNRYSLREQSPGRFTARWYDDAGQRRSKTFPSRKAAKTFLDNTASDLHRGDYIDPRDARRKFREIADDWFATKVKRARTLAGYESLLRNHLLPYFGERPVGVLTTVDVRKWLAGMQRSHAPGTVRNAYRVLKPILDSAVEARCISENPCGTLRRDDLPRSQRTEMLFLTPEEVNALAAEFAQTSSGAAGQMFVHFAVQTGMRFGEVAALRVSNVDLLHRKITVAVSHSVVHGEIIEERPKNGEDRTIRLSKAFAATLRAYVDAAPHIAAHGPRAYLFPSPSDPPAPWRHTSAYPMFKGAARRAGLPAALRLHDLRHTCASLLIAQNVPPKVIQAHLGHRSFAITMDRYGHLYPEAAEQVADAMERAFRVVG